MLEACGYPAVHSLHPAPYLHYTLRLLESFSLPVFLLQYTHHREVIFHLRNSKQLYLYGRLFFFQIECISIKEHFSCPGIRVDVLKHKNTEGLMNIIFLFVQNLHF